MGRAARTSPGAGVRRPSAQLGDVPDGATRVRVGTVSRSGGRRQERVSGSAAQDQLLTSGLVGRQVPLAVGVQPKGPVAGPGPLDAEVI